MSWFSSLAELREPRSYNRFSVYQVDEVLVWKNLILQNSTGILTRFLTFLVTHVLIDCRMAVLPDVRRPQQIPGLNVRIFGIQGLEC